MCVCASFPFGFEGVVWNLIVLVPDHFLSFYFVHQNFYSLYMIITMVGWLFWVSGRLRPYVSLFRGVSKTDGE